MIPMVPLNNKKKVPWNSMELTPAVPWNSMELRVHQFRWHEQFHGIPWNSMELGVRQFRWQEQFHGIPWNLKCANFADTRSSMEFYGIPWKLRCTNFTDMSSSMEFHGIPWNLECANFADTSSSMEFHGTWNAPISLTRAVPWNSMELRMRQFRWHEQFHGIPWNSMELVVVVTLFPTEKQSTAYMSKDTYVNQYTLKFCWWSPEKPKAYLAGNQKSGRDRLSVNAVDQIHGFMNTPEWPAQPSSGDRLHQRARQPPAVRTDPLEHNSQQVRTHDRQPQAEPWWRASIWRSHRKVVIKQCSYHNNIIDIQNRLPYSKVVYPAIIVLFSCLMEVNHGVRTGPDYPFR